MDHAFGLLDIIMELVLVSLIIHVRVELGQVIHNVNIFLINVLLMEPIV
jgi:hypothetical protein